MIKNILYVEDGSVDLFELESTLTAETKIIVYRQGGNPPTLVQPRLPINDILSEEEFKAQKKLEELRKETEELICKLLKEKCLTNRARKLIGKFGIDKFGIDYAIESPKHLDSGELQKKEEGK